MTFRTSKLFLALCGIGILSNSGSQAFVIRPVTALAPAPVAVGAGESSARQSATVPSRTSGSSRVTVGKRRLYSSSEGGTAAGTITQNGVVTVYHKETCPHCKEVLKLLREEYSLEVAAVDVLEGEDSEKKIKQMRTFSGGRNTVPQVFFNSEHLGGNDDVQGLHKEGTLQAKVEEVRANEPSMMKDSWYHPWY